ncbi:hypothetical protein [Pirellula sp. SH-Sr6A]|nr:hypothetical protein [Pirellula sp. SH-Sr6A]
MRVSRKGAKLATIQQEEGPRNGAKLAGGKQGMKREGIMMDDEL